MTSMRHKKMQKRVIFSYIICVICFILSVIIYLEIDVVGTYKSCLKYIKVDGRLYELNHSPYLLHNPNRPTTSFEDLEDFLHIYRNPYEPKLFEKVIIREPYDGYNPSLGEVLGVQISENMSILEKFQYSIRRLHVYQENDPLVPLLLKEMANAPLVKVDFQKGGTQMKLKLTFNKHMESLYKPMRFEREHLIEENHYYFTDYERHHSEIAAFHLDRALGFRRTLPVVGRRLNMTLVREMASPELKETFYTSPLNNTCFMGKCMYHCGRLEAACGNPDYVEGSLTTFLPHFPGGGHKEWRSPWRKSYSAWYKSHWEDKDDYCVKVREIPWIKENSRKLLDLMDLAVFDFLMGNMDRHSFARWKSFDNNSGAVVYDNGRGFGDPFVDEIIILKPIMQCCEIRESTLKTLLRFHNGVHPLSHVMRQSLASDPLSPILWEPHLAALDRRVEIILEAVRSCINRMDQNVHAVIQSIIPIIGNKTKDYLSANVTVGDDIFTRTMDKHNKIFRKVGKSEWTYHSSEFKPSKELINMTALVFGDREY